MREQIKIAWLDIFVTQPGLVLLISILNDDISIRQGSFRAGRGRMQGVTCDFMVW